VFPGSRGDGVPPSFHNYVRRIVARGGLPLDVTAHVLRHSFASLAADLGYSEATIATLIGHKGHSVTSRYMHSADRVLLAAADAVADATRERMFGASHQPGGEVVPLRA
jgi:integrase